MYGLTNKHRIEVLDKIEKQKLFLTSHYIDVDGSKVPLSSFFKNTFINSDRYIAELQHRVWSLAEFAQNRNLVNIFITLTLPSEYHRKKTLRNGKLVRNPNFSHQNLKLYDITTKKRAKSYTKLIIKYYKTLGKKKWTGRIKEISLNPKDYMTVPAVKQLTKMWESIRKDRAWQGLEKEDRLYFRVTEPHKDGTPHLHISAWVPSFSVDRFIRSIHRLYPAPLADISTSYIPDGYKLYDNVYKRDGKWHSAYKSSKDSKSYIKLQIDDTISYLMKYIYKTLDDLRDGKGITDITMWYIFHGICRFYTSRTLISLNVYRPLSGRFDLLELTYHYQNDTITVYLDPDTRQPKIIQYDDIILWNKKRFNLKQYRNDFISSKVKPIDCEIDGIEYYLYFLNDAIKTKPKRKISDIQLSNIVPIVSRMKNVQLYHYFYSLDIDDPLLNAKHYCHVQNTMIERGLLDGDTVSLNEFSFDLV